MQLRLSKSLILIALLGQVAPLPAAAVPTPAPPVIGSKSHLMIDAETGRVLAENQPDERLAPASLTKLMTAYVVFRTLAEGQVTLDETVTISERAWRTGGSRMFVEVGNRVPVQDLLLGMIVQPGNDASVALAEHIAGTEAVFAEMMNQSAAALGMAGSHFLNSTGLPGEEHYSTARDLATLARAIIREFPDYYEWYSLKEYSWNGITQPNRNKLLWRDDSVDGMKTGHTDDAGYCLISSALRDDMRIIAVVLGTSSSKARTDGSQALLNYGFRFFETLKLYTAGEPVIATRIWKSANGYTNLGVLEDVYITIPRGSYDSLEMTRDVPAVLEAPVAAGQPLAEFTVSLNGDTLLTEELRALDDNPEGSLWQRTRDGVSLWFE
jgi:serine-type D-Ala-D-Ala carboxypeptidase (penicillin-binding protein 5/6)